jgi:NADH:ubiquinone oxidoreductase subunit 5 (subunit L)/multisubunit Na+/H+ antiporter MnhA subunit
MNRVGDIGYLIGSAVLYDVLSTLDFSILYTVLGYQFDYLLEDRWSGIPTNFVSAVDAACLFFLIGVVAKSAQIGLHT